MKGERKKRERKERERERKDRHNCDGLYRGHPQTAIRPMIMALGDQHDGCSVTGINNHLARLLAHDNDGTLEDEINPFLDLLMSYGQSQC